MPTHWTVKRAAELFRNESYSESLKVYLWIKYAYKTNAFDLNIQKCRERLSKLTSRTAKQDLSQLNQFFDHIYLVNLKSDSNSRIRAEYCLSLHNINYSVFEAINGYEGEPLKAYDDYMSRPLGNLEKFSSYSQLEIERGKKFIESPGAIGYIFTYRQILQDALKKRYDSILILEDDVAFVHDSQSKIKSFLGSIPNNWKILNLGSSQYGWDNINEEHAREAGYYYPSKINTCGSFAIGIKNSAYQEIMDYADFLDSPFDLFPLGEIYQNSLGQCFSAFPAIAIPDVSKSAIRHSRNQITHSRKMKWPLESIEFPLAKPWIQVLLANHGQLKYSSSLTRFHQRGYIVNFFKCSTDGLRPVHENHYSPFQPEPVKKGELSDIKKDFLKSENCIAWENSSYITEEDFYDFFQKKIHKNPQDLGAENHPCMSYVPGKVSIIIPTHGRADNLRQAIKSCLCQTYDDVEIIVVSDNDTPSQIKLVKDIESELANNSNLRFIYHSQNRNGSAARNTGAFNSTGEFLSFLDDDDVYFPEKIEESVKLLSTLPSYYGGVYCGFLGWNSPSLDASRFTEKDLFKKIVSLNHKSHYIHTNTTTIRRSVFFSLNGFNEAYYRHQDLEFHLRLLCWYKLKPLEKALVKLKPMPTPDSNIPSTEKLKQIKLTLLKDFSSEILSYGEDFTMEVWNAHNDELKRYSMDPSNPMVLPPIL